MEGHPDEIGETRANLSPSPSSLFLLFRLSLFFSSFLVSPPAGMDLGARALWEVRGFGRNRWTPGLFAFTGNDVCGAYSRNGNSWSAMKPSAMAGATVATPVRRKVRRFHNAEKICQVFSNGRVCFFAPILTNVSRRCAGAWSTNDDVMAPCTR